MLLSEFDAIETLKIHTIESLRASTPVNSREEPYILEKGIVIGSNRTRSILMLTSGSIGNAKAVCLTHKQMLNAIARKSQVNTLAANSHFLNWISFDHIACLTEIHLHAMWASANQVHVQAADIVPNPLLFFDLIDKHRVAYTFSPNSFLASLLKALETPAASPLRSRLDLSCLRTIVSGGETSVVETCIALTKILQEYGALENVLAPAFGMTETCGGAIYSKNCPRRDVECNNEFATVGSCIPGMKMLITDGNGKDVGLEVKGNLEVHGPVVFEKYYNNPDATAISFNRPWFITGDLGFVDSLGQYVSLVFSP